MSLFFEFVNGNVWNLVWLSIAVISGSMFIATILPNAAKRRTVSAMAVAKIVSAESALLIDLREKNEFVQGHIPGSKNAPRAQLKEYWANNKIDKEQAMILICASGILSTPIFKTLTNEGFKNIYILEGGIGGWLSANFPLTKK